MEQHAASFIAHAEASTGTELPRFITDEFDAFVQYDILAHGLLRLRCGVRGHDKLLAFSCKRRRFFTPCGERGISQTTAHLVHHVIPHVPVQQWMLSGPVPLRMLLAAQPERVTPVRQVVQRVLTRHLLEAAGLEADRSKALIAHLGVATWALLRAVKAPMLAAVVQPPRSPPCPCPMA